MSALQTAEERLNSAHARPCAGCDRPLSRYNHENLCHPCSRGVWPAPQIRPVVPPVVWRSPEVQHALMLRDFGGLCTLIRRDSALRQEDLAALTGLSQAFLSMLEAGARRLTNIEKIIRLLDGLQAPIELTGPMLRSDNIRSDHRRSDHLRSDHLRSDSDGGRSPATAASASATATTASVPRER